MTRRDGRVSVHAARLSEAGLALEILFTQPIRLGNLAALEASWFRRDARGVIKKIRIPSTEVKGGRRQIVIEVPPELARWIDWHWQNCRPLLLYGSSAELPYLFVGPNGNGRRAPTLGKSLTRRVDADLGKHFTPHLARHLAATIMLEEDPNNLAAVSCILNHSRLETTENIYGVVITSAAQGTWGGTLDDLRKDVAKREKRSRKKRT